MAMAITAAADITVKSKYIPDKNTSNSIAPVEARDISIKVRRPAAWRFVDLSQPIMAENTRDKANLKSTEVKDTSAAQFPNIFINGSVKLGILKPPINAFLKTCGNEQTP
jgi:hypothetical protein